MTLIGYILTSLEIQIFHSGSWKSAAIFSVQDIRKGHIGASSLDYKLDYAAEYLDTNEPCESLSCQYPVNFSRYDSQCWPAFMLDLMPSGAGRDKWLTRRGIADGFAADWELLNYGAGSPPGNLRIREAVVDHFAIPAPAASGEIVAGQAHAGFSRTEIITRGENFIEYAYQHGAITAGASDIQGEAPKFLLVQDHDGRWHAEGALEDHLVAKHWLVKFPRGNTESDRQVLRNECAYLEVARQLDFNVAEALVFEADALFIPRFDRFVSPVGVDRHGLESLCSAAAIAEYGACPRHEVLLQTLAQFSHQPAEDMAEYICRDLLNIILGNKDNYARNMALLKSTQIRLSPIYDFAPMYLDRAGIARVCRWNSDREQAGKPNWRAIVNYVEQAYSAAIAKRVRQRLVELRLSLKPLEQIMLSCGVDGDIVTARTPSLLANSKLL